MKLDAGEIQDVVLETERKRSKWARAAEIWEQDYKLARYEDSREAKRELDGVDVVVSPDPYNIIQVLQRMVANEMRVEIPSISTKEDDEDRSQVMEAWAVSFDTLSNRQQGTNHITDMTTLSGVLGRGAAQILWIGDVIPKGVGTDRILPIWRRTLEPRNVGLGRNAYWTDYGYHKYRTTRAEVEQRYPKFRLPDYSPTDKVSGYYNDSHEVIDFWSLHQGAIWHTVLVDGDYAKSPTKMDYPDIPIIEWYADGAPFGDELGRSMGILHPVHELWRMKCDLMSRVATGLMYHYDPLAIARNFGPDDKIAVGPGETIYLSGEQSLEFVSPQPNVPMAETLLSMIQQGIDQATFPGVTYGEGPGGGNSGYAINSLQQQARGRANNIRDNIEGACEREYELIFSLIEAFAPDEGVQIYARNKSGERGRPLTLNKKIIKGNYANHVRLIPEQPLDDIQKILGWSQLVEKGIISAALFRDEALNIQMPRDEETRIVLEQTLKSPEMQPKVQLRSMQKSFNQDDWELMIVGTPLEQVHQQEQQWREQKKAEEEQAKEQRRMEKEQKAMQEAMMNMPPLSMSMGNPLEPGMNPIPGGFPGQPPISGPPTQFPGMDIQPSGIDGVPPSMAGQFDPNMLGLEGAMPGTFQGLTGGAPPSDEELLRSMGALPPEPPMM